MKFDDIISNIYPCEMCMLLVNFILKVSWYVFSKRFTQILFGNALWFLSYVHVNTQFIIRFISLLFSGKYYCCLYNHVAIEATMIIALSRVVDFILVSRYCHYYNFSRSHRISMKSIYVRSRNGILKFHCWVYNCSSWMMTEL